MCSNERYCHRFMGFVHHSETWRRDIMLHAHCVMLIVECTIWEKIITCSNAILLAVGNIAWMCTYIYIDYYYTFIHIYQKNVIFPPLPLVFPVLQNIPLKMVCHGWLLNVEIPLLLCFDFLHDQIAYVSAHDLKIIATNEIELSNFCWMFLYLNKYQVVTEAVVYPQKLFTL